jgi:hypothetical protein
MHEGKTDGPIFAAERARALSLSKTHASVNIVCIILAPQPARHPRAHTPRKTRGEFRVKGLGFSVYSVVLV